MYYLLLSDEELSKQIHLSVRSIKKYNKSLVKKGILKIVKIGDREIKIFDLDGTTKKEE